MALSIDYQTRIISIPKADLALVQSTPFEIRQLDINAFRMELKDIEDSPPGVPFVDTHRHFTTVTVGGVTLARVIEIINGYTVTFEDGNYAVNLSGANSNIGDVLNLNNVQVRSNNSAGLASSADIEFASFNGGVTIDIINGSSGAVFPIGTERAPVNNLMDALIIAEYRGLKKLYIKESMTGANGMDGGSDLDGFKIVGLSKVGTAVEILESASCVDITVENCTVSGVLDGGTRISNCLIGDIIYVNGHVDECGLFGTLYLGGDELAVFNNCYSYDQDSNPVIDLGGSGQSLAMPNYTGMITLKNLTSATEEIGVGLNAGALTLDSTITAGTIIVSGTGLLIDNTTGDAIVNTEGLMNKGTISEAVWDESIADHLVTGSTGKSVGIAQFVGKVHIDTASGNSGTTFPIGTERVPVDNLADAITIAVANGLDKLHFASNFTFQATDSIANYELHGDGLQKTTLTFTAGCILAYCQVFNAKVTGNETGIIGFDSCHIIDIGSVGLAPSSVEVLVKNCLFEGTLTLPSNYSGRITAVDCSAAPDSSGNPPIIDMGDCTADVQVRNWSGILEFTNCTNAVDIRVFFTSGGAELDSTVTAGNFLFAGAGVLTDNSTSVTSLNTDGLMNKELITETTIKEVYIDTVHGTSGTAFPLGTPANPVDNIADAKIIADRIGIEHFHLHGSITLTGDWSGYSFASESYETGTITCSSAILESVVFNNLELIGSASSGEFAANNCRFSSGFTNIHADLENCQLFGTMTTMASGYINGDRCTSATGVVIDMNGTSALGMANFSGVLTIGNSTNAANTIGITGTYLLTLNSTITAGQALLGGMGTVTNNATSFTYILDKTLPSSTWEELTTAHTTAGTTGKALSDAGAAGNPWEAPVAGNTTAGTFGELVGKKLLTIAKFLGLK